MGLKLGSLLTTDATLAEPTGERIGRYTLLEKLGEGGCGTVYLAEQEEPVHRQVALKVIKLGMDTRQVIARFEAERQTLALMEHPLVAKVFDAGATESGRPYFVMELVRGARITDYCDQHQLSTRDRLQLFIQVCQAIQHAHQKGIIHRDLKPSNVLVARHEGIAAPRVIDFGIAKATQQRLSDETLTESHLFLGTPAYMSPEQASGTDIDTRSDIYSLGVLLYELLTGRLPFDREALRRAGFEEICRRIREEEPPRPSTRLSTLAAPDLTVLALRRQTEPAKLTNQIRGDLDWIVMKALEKDRVRRYESAVALAEDVQRHLDHHPVVACPPTKLYQFKKFARRHRAALAAAGAIAVVLVAAALVSAWQAWRATRAERAQRQLREQAEQARVKEAAERQRARATANFLAEMLRGVGPSVALGRDTTLLREILDHTARRVGRDLKNQPEVEADLRGTLGMTYRELGQFTQAEAMQREALRLESAFFGPAHPRVIRTLSRLALVRHDRGDLPEAETLFRKAIGLSDHLPDGTRPEAASLRNNLANLLSDRGQFTEAEGLLREALALDKQRHGDRHESVATVLGNLGQLLQRRRRLAEAEESCRASLAIYQEVLEETHPNIVTSLNTLARILTDRNDLAGAELLFGQSLALRRKLVGDAHPAVAVTLNNLGDVVRRRGRLDDAEKLHREALGILRQYSGDAHRDMALTLWHLAEVLQERGDFAGAETLLHDAVASRRALSPFVHPETAQVLNSLAQVQERLNKLSEAEATLREVVSMQEQIGDERPDVATCLGNLAKLLRRSGKLVEAEVKARDSIALWRKLLGAESEPLAGMLHSLGLILQARNDLPKAESAFHEEVTVWRKLTNAPSAADSKRSFEGALASALSYLGTVLRQRSRYDEAEKAHQQALALRKKLLGEVHPDVALSLLRLAEVHWGRRDWALAEPLLVEALEIQRKAWTNNPAKVEEGLLNLAELRYQSGKFADAEPLYRELVLSVANRLQPENDEVSIATVRLARLLTEWAWAERGTAGSATAQRAREAERLLHECLSVRTRKLDSSSSRIADTKSRLGGAMLVVAVTTSDLDATSREARFAASEPLLLESSAALQQSRTADPRIRREALERLARLYEAWNAAAPGAGKSAKATEWRLKLDAFDSAAAAKRKENAPTE